MYIENRVKNDRKKSEILALLSCERGNSERCRAEKLKEFTHSGFPHWENKRAGSSKIFLSFVTLFLYITLVLPTYKSGI